MKWYVRDVKVAKDFTFRDDIARETLQVKRKTKILKIKLCSHLKCVELRMKPDVELPTGQDLPKNQ